MWLFYDFVTKEFNILPSENYNKSFEITNYNFNVYTKETNTENDPEFVEINHMDDFYEMVSNHKETHKKTYRFVDKYTVIKTIYSNNEFNYILYQFICL
jgi:hypothetical protein